MKQMLVLNIIIYQNNYNWQYLPEHMV